MKKSPFKNTENSWGEGGSPKTPWNGKSWGGGAKKRREESSVEEVWIFSGTTHPINIGKVNYAFLRDQKMFFFRTGNELVHTMP